MHIPANLLVLLKAFENDEVHKDFMVEPADFPENSDEQIPMFDKPYFDYDENVIEKTDIHFSDLYNMLSNNLVDFVFDETYQPIEVHVKALNDLGYGIIPAKTNYSHPWEYSGLVLPSGAIVAFHNHGFEIGLLDYCVIEEPGTVDEQGYRLNCTGDVLIVTTHDGEVIEEVAQDNAERIADQLYSYLYQEALRLAKEGHNGAELSFSIAVKMSGKQLD